MSEAVSVKNLPDEVGDGENAISPTHQVLLHIIDDLSQQRALLLELVELCRKEDGESPLLKALHELVDATVANGALLESVKIKLDGLPTEMSDQLAAKLETAKGL